MIGDVALRSERLAPLLSDAAQVQRWLDVEAALVTTLAELGHVAVDAATDVARTCHVERIDLDALRRDAAAAATPVLPLVRQLTAQVGDAGRAAVHLGATSQDVLDSATMGLCRDAVSILAEELTAVGDRCAVLARQHRATVMAGRTLLQHAVPLPFGLKAARWLAAVARDLDRLQRLRFPVQLGGAVGTSAAFGQDGVAVAAGVAARLGLDDADVPWHGERDAVAEVGLTVALAAGTCAELAGEVIRLAQTDIGEVVLRDVGGSSTMPHKRNPVDATMAVTAGRIARAAAAALLTAGPHEHERAAGAWQFEWETLPRLLDAAVAAAERARRTLEVMDVDAVRARANLVRSGPSLLAERLALALAEGVGRTGAHDLVAELTARAATEHRPLDEVAVADPRVVDALGRDAVGTIFDAGGYLGSSDAWIERVLDRWETRA